MRPKLPRQQPKVFLGIGGGRFGPGGWAGCVGAANFNLHTFSKIDFAGTSAGRSIPRYIEVVKLQIPVAGLAVLTALLAPSIGRAGSYVLKQQAGLKNPSGGTVWQNANSWSYSQGSQGYGGKSGFAGSASCTGEITTIWKWVPANIPNPAPGALTDGDPTNDVIPDPLGTVPEKVIIKETCEAQYSGQTGMTGGLVGAASNGLGFLAQTSVEPFWMWTPGPDGSERVQTGWSYRGISTGVRYKLENGQAEIPVKCTPDVVVSTPNGYCVAQVWYSSQILVPAVNLAGTTRFYDPHKIMCISGQGIAASLSTPEANVVPGTHLWSFTSTAIDPFKDYLHGSIGRRDDLLASDYQKAALNFFANKAGAAQVSCTATLSFPISALLAGGLPQITVKSKELTSVRPEVKSWIIRNGEISLFPAAISYGSGTGPTLNGQNWSEINIDLEQPFGDVGTGSLCQLINANRRLYRHATESNQSTHYVKSPWNNQEALDMAFIYPYGQVWQISSFGSGYDSPQQSLVYAPGDWHKSTAQDDFKSYVMYLPPQVAGRPVAYIPLACYSWSWAASATRTREGGNWSPFVLSDLMTTQPLWEITDDHPEWTKLSPSPFGYVPVN